ncbi:MAG TPA: DUF427 domain-containing protein [Acidimicrobiales bacterium]|nr:DUF427 domain-containing protein [Acidimicrobiales bacterium]
MTEVARPRRTPGADHPISIERHDGRVVVRHGDVVLAVTDRALVLREAGYAPVHYVPVADVAEGVLRASERRTYCPYKGDATYDDVVAEGFEVRDAAWRYRAPFDEVGAIAGHVAFYPHLVTITVEPVAAPPPR